MIEYTGKTNINEKINALLDEMLKDEDFIYSINILEKRINEKISELTIELIEKRTSMPNF